MTHPRSKLWHSYTQLAKQDWFGPSFDSRTKAEDKLKRGPKARPRPRRDREPRTLGNQGRIEAWPQAAQSRPPLRSGARVSLRRVRSTTCCIPERWLERWPCGSVLPALRWQRVIEPLWAYPPPLPDGVAPIWGFPTGVPALAPIAGNPDGYSNDYLMLCDGADAPMYLVPMGE